MTRKTKNVLGFKVDIISFEDAVRFLNEHIQKQEGVHVVTINPEIIESANKDAELASIIHKSELVIADGSGITWALSLKGEQQERIPGIDLAYRMLESANSLKYSVALIGAKQGVLEQAIKNIKNEFDDINISYSHNGYFPLSKDDEIINMACETNPSLILVAMGSPKQELFIKKFKKALPGSTFIGVGGSFDVWAGEVERAPEFFRIIGCEWIYRTFKQPQRLKRIYKTLPMFAIKAIIESVKLKFIDKGSKND